MVRSSGTYTLCVYISIGKRLFSKHSNKIKQNRNDSNDRCHQFVFYGLLRFFFRHVFARLLWPLSAISIAFVVSSHLICVTKYIFNCSFECRKTVWPQCQCIGKWLYQHFAFLYRGTKKEKEKRKTHKK